MHLEKVNIHEHSYTLAIAYQNDEKLREELNRLTQQVWEFTFENFYQSGFGMITVLCIPCSKERE